MLILLLTGLLLSLQYRPVQSYFGKKAAAFLSRELNAQVSLEGLFFKPFTSLQLHELYVSDQQGDTLFYAEGVEAGFDLARLLQNQLSIDQVNLSNAHFHLRVDGEGKNNLAFLIDYFTPTNGGRRNQQKLHLDLHRVELQNLSFLYQDARQQQEAGKQQQEAGKQQEEAGVAIDFSDLELSELSGIFSDLDFTANTAAARIQRLSFREKSGFHLRRLDSRAHIAGDQIELRELLLQTNQSEIKDYILLSYTDFGDFNDFIEKVQLHLELDHARIASADIAYFAPVLYDLPFDAQLSGSLKGTVAAIQGERIRLQTSDQTQLQGRLSITGLPDMSKTLFDITLDQLHSNVPEIEKMVPQFSDRKEFDLPAFLDQLGQLRFNGSFKGHYDDFVVQGELQTGLGMLETDLGIRLLEGTTHYTGEIRSQEFDLGQLVQVPNLDHIGFEGFVDGNGFAPDDRNINLNIHAPYLDFKQYRYANINAAATLSDQILEGDLTITDPNLRLDLSGFSSLDTDSIVHDLHANIYYANFSNTQLFARDSLVIHAAEIHSELKGQHFNDVQGEVSIHNLLFDSKNSPERKHISAIHAQAQGLDDERNLQLESDVLAATLSGQVDFYTLASYFRGMANHYMPSLALASRPSGIAKMGSGESSEQAFALELRLKKGFEHVAGFLSPSLYLADSSSFSGHFSPQATAFELKIPELHLGPIHARHIQINEEADSTALNLEVKALETLLYGRQTIPYLAISQTLQNNRLNYTVHATDTLRQHEAHLRGELEFLPNRRIDLHSFASELLLNGRKWQIEETSATIHPEWTRINNLVLNRGDQRIMVDGYLSGRPEDQLHLTFDRFDLNTIQPFLPPLNFDIHGQLQGRTSINSIFNKPYATADLQLNQLSLDKTPLGNIVANADFDQERNRINLAISQEKDQQQRLFVGGSYHVGQDEDNLDLLARFDQTSLDVLQVILKDLISNVRGSLTGQANLTGTLAKLKIDGTGRLDDAAFTVNYLNTPYRANGPLAMRNTAFVIDDLVLRDPGGHQAQVQGRIDMQRPTQPQIQASINATNFLVLNTSFRDNPLYYGTAFATGRFQFQGTPEDMVISINARTEDQTVFNIPLNTATSLGNYEFIRFTDLDNASLRQKAAATAATTAGTITANSEANPANRLNSGLRLNMDLQVTPAATTNIYTDLGELSGSGEGQLALRITSLGDFEMFGDYRINTGKFTFSAQDFINKIFEIKQGGNIRWTGKPTDASIALTAFYEQRTSLSPLYDAAGRTTNEQRVTARAEMELSGNLLRPGINFGLDFPSDPYVKDELQSYLSDANNVNQQALSLIVRRSFSPGSTTDFGREINSTLLSAGTELAFNQLNNLISQSLNLNFIDLNIRSLNDASASLRLFNDRLIFTGGITDLRNQPINDLNVFRREGIATDAELLYLIRKDGRLILRGSNRLNTRHFLLNPTDEYISALGLIYRREFDSLAEFFRSRK